MRLPLTYLFAWLVTVDECPLSSKNIISPSCKLLSCPLYTLDIYYGSLSLSRSLHYKSRLDTVVGRMRRRHPPKTRSAWSSLNGIVYCCRWPSQTHTKRINNNITYYYELWVRTACAPKPCSRLCDSNLTHNRKQVD